MFIPYLAAARRSRGSLPSSRAFGSFPVKLIKTILLISIGILLAFPLLSLTGRLMELDQQMPQLLELSKNDKSNNIQYLYKLYWSASDVAEDPTLRDLVDEQRWQAGCLT